MLRIYTKLPFYLTAILSFSLTIEAQAAAWSQSSCRARCTDNVCQKNVDMKKLCQIKCDPTALPQACGGMQQGMPSAGRLNEEGESNDDSPTVPPPPPITRYYESAIDDSHTPMTEEIPHRAQALEGNILREARIPEITDMIIDRDMFMEGDTPILTAYGILKILKKMGKINSNFDLNKIPYGTLFLGESATTKESREDDGEIHEEVIATFYRGYTGTFSNQVFLVTISDDLLPTPGAARNFVIKGVDWAGRTPPDKIKSRTEPTPIKELQNTARVTQIIVPKLQKLKNLTNLPVLHTSEDIGYYFDEKGNKNYIAVLETAPGETLSSLTHSFIDSINSGNADPTISENWNIAMGEVGYALGKLHFLLASPEVQKRFLNDFDLAEFKTVVHGDFHFNNIFFDNEDLKVSFIDVSSMADSIYNPISVLEDLYAFYNYTKYFHPYLNNLDGNGIKLINEGFREFARGYAVAVAPSRQAELKNIIYDQFKQWTYLVQSHYASFMESYQVWVSDNVPSAVDDGNVFADPRNMMVDKIRRERPSMIPNILHNMLQDPINE